MPALSPLSRSSPEGEHLLLDRDSWHEHVLIISLECGTIGTRVGFPSGKQTERAGNGESRDFPSPALSPLSRSSPGGEHLLLDRDNYAEYVLVISLECGTIGMRVGFLSGSRAFLFSSFSTCTIVRSPARFARCPLTRGAWWAEGLKGRGWELLWEHLYFIFLITPTYESVRICRLPVV